MGALGAPFHSFFYSYIVYKNRHFWAKFVLIWVWAKKIEIFFCHFSTADYSLVVDFSFQWTRIPLRAWSQLSEMVWHLQIGPKMAAQLTRIWWVVFLVIFWQNFRGLFWAPKSLFWWNKKHRGMPLLVFHIFEVKTNFGGPPFSFTIVRPLLLAVMIIRFIYCNTRLVK